MNREGVDRPTPRTGALFWPAFVIFNLVLAGYFLDSVPTPNPTSRVVPVLSLYEQGTYRIDTYEQTTIDKSFVDGHYYSDKAPLSTWLVLPIYGVLRPLVSTGPPLRHPVSVEDDAFRRKWLSVAVPGAVVCGTVPFVIWGCLVLRRIIRAAPGSSVVALAMLPLYGSFAGAYSGVYMGHLLSGVLLCGSYVLLRENRSPAVCGLLLGLGVLAEYPTALALPIWIYEIVRRRPGHLPRFLAGGLPCAVALLAYNRLITGSWFTTPYDYVADDAFAAMRSSYGVRLPQLDALWGLLFSTFRGVFFYAPALIVIAVAYVSGRSVRQLAADCVTPLGLLTLAYIALISSYFVWWGGWSYGPRHLIPVVMLLLYEGIPVVAESGRAAVLLYVASTCGILMVWLAKATVLHVMPEQFGNPVFQLALPALIAQHIRPDSILTSIFNVNALIASLAWGILFLLGLVRLQKLYGRGAP